MLSRVRQASSVGKAAAARPRIIFPGCGIFFWHQAGVLSGLAKRLDLDKAQFAGASGGALTATLAGCGVTDRRHTLSVAEQLCDTAGVFERGPWGLRGIWGGIVKEWLERLLPTDAAEKCSERVHILVHRPFRGGRLVSEFESRDDLISACMASVHIPFFMDGRATWRFRGESHIDSDLFSMVRGSRALENALPADGAPSFRVSQRRDERIRERYRKTGDFARLTSLEGVREMAEWGETHVDKLDDANVLWPLRSARRPQPPGGVGAGLSYD